MILNPFDRFQKQLKFHQFYQSDGQTCACGCGSSLSRRRKKWASDNCRDEAYVKFAVLKGDTEIIRDLLFQLDEGYCRSCGVYDDNWEADHIHPVQFGGGACNLSNFQTLCPECHKIKTKYQRLSQREVISWQHSSNPFTIFLNAFEAEEHSFPKTSIRKQAL